MKKDAALVLVAVSLVCCQEWLAGKLRISYHHICYHIPNCIFGWTRSIVGQTWLRWPRSCPVLVASPCQV